MQQQEKIPHIKYIITNKVDLIPKILELLKKPEFCNQEPEEYKQLQDFLYKLKDNSWFVIDYPYVDRHYRDTYYYFYSSKYRETSRDCIRVHVFENEINKNDIFDNNLNLDINTRLDKNAKLNKRYWGFFIIRPLLLCILGRSLISPKALKNNNFVCCLMKNRVSLMGKEFTVHGFPHISQDKETHRCAESALWSYIEYFGNKYQQYKPLLPSQIMNTLLDNSEHRVLPSEGLTRIELAKCLQSSGFQCKIHSITKRNDPKKRAFFSMTLQIYIESGIPLLLELKNEGNGHAVLAIGHDENDSNYDKQNYPELQTNSWVNISSYEKKLVLIDDNMPPYQIADMDKPTTHYEVLKDMAITSFIVPLPVHMFLTAESAYALAENIFNTRKVGLKTIGEKWITRLLLTGSRSFKDFIYNDSVMPDNIREVMLQLHLPRFIWICEIYKEDEFTKNGKCSGLLIIDATGNGKSLSSVIWYALDIDLFIHNNLVWDEKSKPIKPPFQMGTYRNNLKGEWNEWIS